MASIKWIAVVALLLVSALAAPGPLLKNKRQAACTNPKQRKAWHKMADDEKKSYIDAVRCLMESPAKIPLRGAKTRFDEFVSLHVLQNELAHFVGSFLTWHRAHMWAYEQVLEKECGYAGGQPYWEESYDAGKFSASDVLDPVTGFGGDGVAPGGCIQDGPFANYTISVGPGWNVTDHCIARKVSDRASLAALRSLAQLCMLATTFERVWNCIEGSPHAAGHSGIGGTLINGLTSPTDPIFYLHHTWIDKLWWDWQKQDLPARLSDIGGRNRMPGGGVFGEAGGAGTFQPPGGLGGALGEFGGPLGPRPDDVEEPLPEGDNGGSVVTLGHVNNMLGVVPDVITEDLMDIRSGIMCYDYVDAYEEEEE